MPDDKLGCRRSKSFSLHGCMLIYVNKMSVSYDQDTNEIEVYRAKLRQKVATKLWKRAQVCVERQRGHMEHVIRRAGH